MKRMLLQISLVFVILVTMFSAAPLLAATTVSPCPTGGVFEQGIFKGKSCDNPIGITINATDGLVDGFSIDDVLIVIRNVVTVFLAPIVGTVFMIMLVVGGVVYVSSNGNDKRIALGKNLLTYAIIGFVIAIASYAIVEIFIRLIGGAVL